MVQIDYFFATISPFVYLAGEPAGGSRGQAWGDGALCADQRPGAVSRAPGARCWPNGTRPAKLTACKSCGAGQCGWGAAGFGTSALPGEPRAVVLCRDHGGQTGRRRSGRAGPGLSPCGLGRGGNIADEEVVAGIVAKYGYDPKAIDRGMFSAAETYAANLEEAVARGVFGVPFYVVGEERFWGQDRLEDLDLYLGGLTA